MTRNADLDLLDLLGCDHAPETPLIRFGGIVAWVCRCGSKEHIVGSCQCSHCYPPRTEIEKENCE